MGGLSLLHRLWAGFTHAFRTPILPMASLPTWTAWTFLDAAWGGFVCCDLDEVSTPAGVMAPAGHRPLCVPLSEYTITMYDTKTRELRWNATYFDYAAALPEDDGDYSE